MQLPEVVKCKPAEPVPVPHVPVTPLADNQRCVLVIDDDPNVHRLIERTLQGEGFTVRFAADGKEGLRLARELRPRVITLDVMMPVLDGFQVLSELHKREAWRQIPVVVLTAKDLSTEERQRLAGQTQKIFEKGSYVREELLREVRNCVERFRSA